MSREITKEIIIENSIEEVFSALITPSSIKKWWSATKAIVLAKTEGTHAVSWGEEDNPDYISVATIKEINPPSKLLLIDHKYYSKEGALPFEADLDVEFSLQSQGSKTKLRLKQTGFPQDKIADKFYNACVKGWNDTLASLKKVVEES